VCDAVADVCVSVVREERNKHFDGNAVNINSRHINLLCAHSIQSIRVLTAICLFSIKIKSSKSERIEVKPLHFTLRANIHVQICVLYTK